MSLKLFLSYSIFYPYNLVKKYLIFLAKNEKKILILGSSGQIGSHLEEFLSKKKIIKC